MSYVTNLILIPGYSNDDEEHQWLDELNSKISSEWNPTRIIRVDQYATSAKAMEEKIYLAAFLYHGRKEICEFLEKVKWQNRTEVLFLIREQDDDEFSTHRLDESKDEADHPD